MLSGFFDSYDDDEFARLNPTRANMHISQFFSLSVTYCVENEGRERSSQAKLSGPGRAWHPRVTRRDELGLRLDHVDDGVDERQVGERLREVAEVAAAAGVDLLGVEAERAGEGQQLLARACGRGRARRSRPAPTPARTSRW